jgi:hypothetical protein
MGLDMYLLARESYWDYMDEGKMKKKILALPEFEGIECQYAAVEFNVIYWRKANQIHGWFVENVQDGQDDCHEYPVDREHLQELLDLCKMAFADKDPTGLAPVEGFFFGNNNVDDWYWDDIKKTIKSIEAVLKNEKLKNFSFYYQSSW